MQQSVTHKIYIPTNQQNFDNPRTLTPMSKNDFTVSYLMEKNLYII